MFTVCNSPLLKESFLKKTFVLWKMSNIYNDPLMQLQQLLTNANLISFYTSTYFPDTELFFQSFKKKFFLIYILAALGLR